MATSKKLPKTPEKPQGRLPLINLLIIVSLIMNGYFLFYKQDKKQQKLVTVEGRSFHWKDISDQGKRAMAGLDQSYYANLKRESDIWVENQILPKEAQQRSVSVGELIKTEVLDKVQVTDEEVYRRYVQSPVADNYEWPQVLKEIDKELRGQRIRELKAAYLRSLYAKYGVRYYIEPPGGVEGSALTGKVRFPIFRKDLVGRSVRGAKDAPVAIELFSDFMCPFSVKFNKTILELQKMYPDKVQTTFRHFPLSFHEGAHLMAEASICAEEQGKFWEYHDTMMSEAKKRDKAELVQIAKDLGLSTPTFVDCLDSGRNAKKVDADIQRGQKLGISGTPGFLINGRRGSGAMPIESLKPLIDWHLSPSGVYPGKAAQPAKDGAGQARPAPQQLDAAKIYQADPQWIESGFSRGSKDAPVALMEFFDYNCPFCRKGAEVTEALMAQYGSKLRVISKHNPLAMHANAAKTSEALLCAHDQSKFMEMRKEVLGDSWGKNSVEDLKAIAKKVGLNSASFDACLDSGKMKALVDKDMQVASSAGAQSTPTFFINGTPVIGAQPIETFQKIIDEKLAGTPSQEKSAK